MIIHLKRNWCCLSVFVGAWKFLYVCMCNSSMSTMRPCTIKLNRDSFIIIIMLIYRMHSKPFLSLLLITLPDVTICLYCCTVYSEYKNDNTNDSWRGKKRKKNLITWLHIVQMHMLLSWSSESHSNLWSKCTYTCHQQSDWLIPKNRSRILLTYSWFHLFAKAMLCKEIIKHVQDLVVERYWSGEGYRGISITLDAQWNTMNTIISKWRATTLAILFFQNWQKDQIKIYKKKSNILERPSHTPDPSKTCDTIWRVEKMSKSW